MTAISAQTFEAGGIYYNIYHEGSTDSKSTSVLVTHNGDSPHDYPGRYTGVVVIPETVVYEDQVYTVVGINMWAFWGCTELTGVVIPKTVTFIENRAFYECTALEYVTIPNSVTWIGEAAFEKSGWYNKQSDGLLYLDNWLLGYKGEKPMGGIHVADGTRGIANHAFKECEYISDVYIPGSVKYIGYSAFCNCDGLTMVSLSEGVEHIFGESFSGCNNLEYATIPEGVKEIGYMAFAGCDKLMDITIPESVTQIGASAFYDTGWYNNQPGGLIYIGNWLIHHKGDIRGDIVIANGTKYIGTYALAYSSYLKSVSIPNSVVSIASGAFYGCSLLEAVSIGNSVTKIGSSAFGGCSSLSCISIPESVEYVGSRAFSECSSLKELCIENSDKPLSIGSDDMFTCPLEILYLGRNLLYEWHGYDLYFPETLKSLTIGNAVTNISDFVIRRDNMESIVVETENRVFDSREGCHAIIETARNTLVFGCKNTKIPNGVTHIGESAFEDCAGLSNISIPAGVVSIGDFAFADCSDLERINVPSNVKSIGEGAFYDCTSLSNVVLAEGVTSIGAGAFCCCESLTDIVVPNSVADFESSVFEYCVGLKNATIGNGITNLGMGAFFYCIALTDIVIGANVESLGEGVFYYCDALESIHLMNDKPATVAEHNFTDEHYSTVELFVPTGTLSAYKSADVWKNFLNIKEYEYTAIDEVECEGKNARTVYDLHGRRVDEITENGIYIVGGKKVMVK